MNRTPRFLPLVCAATLAALAGCAHHVRQPSPTASPVATPAPGASSTPYSYIFTPPVTLAANADPNAPQIHEVDLNARFLAAP